MHTLAGLATQIVALLGEDLQLVLDIIADIERI
jgi:hypothetical protein